MTKQTTNDNDLQALNQEIYKHSLELAIVNKTLSLLRKLYQISSLTLDPPQLSEKISDAVRVDLNMEITGIISYDSIADVLAPFKFAESERLTLSLKNNAVDFNGSIKHASTHAVLGDLLKNKTVTFVTTLGDIWNNADSKEKFAAVSSQSHIKAILLYPLVANGAVTAVLLLAINRDYDALSDFEKDALKSLIDVVAVALDKALLYQNLQIANEQLQALDKARAEFISIASHQLRTPPATIKWYVGAVLSGDFGPLSDELRAALERTRLTNDAQIATIDDLLNASRIERGKLEFFFEKSALEPIVADLVMQLRPLAQMKKMDLEYTPPKNAAPDILMDKEKIRQVINNMIDNGIKYSKQGIIKIVLESDEDNVIVKVTDQGKGIRTEEISSLFQKYSRGHDSATHATGLGLGMYVAKIVVEQHNGKIWAESAGEGKGSTFAFSLPLQSALFTNNY